MKQLPCIYLHYGETNNFGGCRKEWRRGWVVFFYENTNALVADTSGGLHICELRGVNLETGDFPHLGESITRPPKVPE